MPQKEKMETDYSWLFYSFYFIILGHVKKTNQDN